MPRSSGKDPSFDAAIGKNLTVLRMSHGDSRKDLSEALGISQQQLHKYETGKNRMMFYWAVRICQHYNVPLSALLTGYGDDDRIPDMGSSTKCFRLVRGWSKLPPGVQDKLLSITLRLVPVARENAGIANAIIDL